MAGAEALAALDERLAAWARAVGHRDPPAREDEKAAGGSLRLCVRRLGWTQEPATGRSAGGLRLTAEYLLTADGPESAAADGLLADLVARASGFADRVAPVPPDAPLWRALGRPPCPALRAGLAFDARPAPPDAPAIKEVALGLAPREPSPTPSAAGAGGAPQLTQPPEA